MLSEELSRVEEMCREAIAKRPDVSLVEALGGADSNDWLTARKTLGLMESKAEQSFVETLDAAYMGMRMMYGDTPEAYALGRKLRSEQMAKNGGGR